MTAPLAVEPHATSMHLLLDVCRVPFTNVHFCAPLPLHSHICSGTPSEKFAFGTSMHSPFQSLISELVLPPLVVSDRPYAPRISLTGWNHIVPPDVQLPVPPEVTPCAWLPEIQEPPESPGSAQASLRDRPETAPWAYTTVSFRPSRVPQCQPEVRPDRQIELPIAA